MKINTIILALTTASSVLAGILPQNIPPRTEDPIIMANPTDSSVVQIETGVSHLEKRSPRDVVVNKQWLKEESEKVHGTNTEEAPPPWIRTIHESVVEVVTPTIIAGVTFSTKPLETTVGTEWWISVKDDGSPKTIKPKLKNGQIKHVYPDVKTYFQTATTIVHKQENLKAHNLKKGDVVEEVVMIPEDDTYVKLSPLMRCTPDFYFKRGPGNMEESEPFCRPKDNQRLRVGKTYFLTWYSRFYNEAKNVRFHYAYVKESASEKGMWKRDAIADPRAPIKDVSDKVAEILPNKGSDSSKGAVAGAFHTTEWILNDQGFIPIDIQKSWLRGHVYRKVLVAIQPDTVDDEDFSILDAPHLILQFQLQESVGKNRGEMRRKMDMTTSGDSVYYVIMLIPTMVILALFIMYLFVQANKKHRDLSGLRKPRKSRFGNVGRYSIPYAETDLRKPGSLKQL